MTESAEKLIPSLAALPAEDRAELAAFLIQSLDEETDPDWDAAWTTELERRWKEIESGRVVGIPAEEAFRKPREKFL